jgi:hypothetical protein
MRSSREMRSEVKGAEEKYAANLNLGKAHLA